MKITPTPIVLKDIVVSIGTDDYAPALSQAVFTPSTSDVSYVGMSPGASWTDQTEPTWKLDLTFVQDWTDPNSLANRLYEDAGTTVSVKFQPKDGVALPAFNSEVTLAHGPIGGPGGQYGTSTVSMGCTKPARDLNNDGVAD